MGLVVIETVLHPGEHGVVFAKSIEAYHIESRVEKSPDISNVLWQTERLAVQKTPLW